MKASFFSEIFFSFQLEEFNKMAKQRAIQPVSSLTCQTDEGSYGKRKLTSFFLFVSKWEFHQTPFFPPFASRRSAEAAVMEPVNLTFKPRVHL